MSRTQPKTLMITPYPPYRDGIAVYAAQEVIARRRAGEHIDVLSPTPSAAHQHLVLGGPKGWARLLSRLAPFDRVIIQLYPELLHGACGNPIERVAAWAGLEAAVRRRPTELRVHEVDYGPARRNPLERLAGARALRAADVVAVHTPAERTALCETFGLDPSEVTLFDHGQYFAPRSAMSQTEARAELGIDPASHMFLTIGFLQAHKGFDRAVRAFAESGVARPGSTDASAAGAELHVVGSVRVDVPEFVAYAASLRRQIDAVPGAYFHERYVSDEAFDRWILAADTIVLPYREIFSSGVVERANLLGRPVLASRVGGPAEQIEEGSAISDDDAELVTLMRDRAGGSFAPAAPPERVTASTQAIEAAVRSSLPQSSSSVLDLGERLTLPPPYSHRPLVGRAKQAVRIVTGWQLHPIVDRINHLESQLEQVLAERSNSANPE